MRKVILVMQMTLDGFIEGPNEELDWAMKEDEKTWKDVFELQNWAGAVFAHSSGQSPRAGGVRRQRELSRLPDQWLHRLRSLYYL